MRRFIILISTLAAIAAASFAQAPDTLWTRTFGGNGNDHGYYVLQTADSGFIIVGDLGYSIVYVVKTDSDGDTMWTRVYNEPRRNWGYCIQKTSDDGYIICGKTEVGHQDDWIYLLKINSYGDAQWTHRYGGSGWEVGWCVQEVSTGGYIVAGSTRLHSAGYDDVCWLKTDMNGNLLWMHRLGGNSTDQGNYVIEIDEGGYIICGSTSSYGSGSKDVYLIKTDQQGDTIWTKTFGGNNWDVGNCVQQTSDGGYIVAGHANGSQRGQVYLIKTDPFGNEVWSRTFGSLFYDEEGFSVRQTSDGGYIIAGHTGWDPSEYISDVYIIKVNSMGFEEWNKVIGGEGDDYARCIQETYDGGFIIAGTKNISRTSNGDMWLIRLAPPPPSRVTIDLTPINPPIRIPANGGFFRYGISVINNTPAPLTLDGWTLVMLPNGGEYVFDVILNARMPGSASFSCGKIQWVPRFAPPGNYQFAARLGDYPDIVWSQDLFPFEKSAFDFNGSDIAEWMTIDENQGNQLFNPENESSSGGAVTGIAPNPFNRNSLISFTLEQGGYIELSVFDVKGREAANLASGEYPAGNYEFSFNGEGLPTGLYFIRLTAGKSAMTKKCLLLK